MMSMGGEVPDSGDSPSDKSTRLYIWSQVFRTIHILIRAATWIALAYIGFLAVETLAGRETTIWASLSLVKSSRGLPWVLVVSLLLWAVGERKLRQKNIKSMGSHIEALERSRDRKRTSSGLLPTGQTNPKDNYDT